MVGVPFKNNSIGSVGAADNHTILVDRDFAWSIRKQGCSSAAPGPADRNFGSGRSHRQNLHETVLRPIAGAGMDFPERPCLLAEFDAHRSADGAWISWRTEQPHA